MGEAKGMERGEKGGGVRALESWREPWIGNDPESSRSTTAAALIRTQNAEQVQIWNIKRGVCVCVCWGRGRGACAAAVD